MTDQTQGSGLPRVRIPASVAEMQPPKASSLISEATSFIRAHYDELLPHYEVLSGEKPSTHGKFELDEAEYVFAAKKIASENGYAYLNTVITANLLRALRFGFRRNTGEKALTKRLKLQHKQRRIEDKRQQH
jgi:hypothetical protein